MTDIQTPIDTNGAELAPWDEPEEHDDTPAPIWAIVIFLAGLFWIGTIAGIASLLMGGE